MSKSSLLESVPVNLIQQPVERAAIIVWLIAFAQFVTYMPGPSISPALSWLLTAPVLMMASILIAIRSQNSIPLYVTFFSGAIAVIYFFNPEMPSLVSFLKTMGFGFLGNGFLEDSFSGYAYSGNNYLGMSLHSVHKSLMTLGVYTIAFWLIISRFLQSRFFSLLQQFVRNKNRESELAQNFQTIMFVTAFVALNVSVVFSLIQPDHYSLISLSLATLFLFVCGQHLSEGKRGFLLPVYITLLLASYLFIQTDINTPLMRVYSFQSLFGLDVMVFVSWSFLLWFGHNFVSQSYNRVFTNLKITTTLWPVFGLLILMAFLFDASLNLIFQPVYLMVLITYLFLMLRNTSQPLITWAIILLLSWLLLVVEFTVNNGFFWSAELPGFARYGQMSILYCFSLILFSVVWQRFLNQRLSRFGWYIVSFQKPVLSVSFVVTILWFAVNVILLAGLLTGWFDLIHEGLAIEKTTVLVIASFIILSLFINNQILANLIHASLVLGMIVLWGVTWEGLFAESKSIPVYSLFAVIHLLWVLLPSLIQLVCDKLHLSYPENFIKTSGNWVYISFVVTLVSLFNFADNPSMGLESASFLSSVVLLFAASLIMVKRYASDLWIIFSYLLATGLILSIRFMILGDVAVNAYDTAGILILSFILFSLNRWNLLPLLSLKSGDVAAVLVKVLPLTALLTIPWQTASLHSSISLLILGVFYLLIKKDSRILLYTGLVLINLAIYMWMPLLSTYTNLMLFYVLPVSMSLLLVSHLHKNEMKTELQNKIRFIALSLLYLLATADVFISSSLLLFFIGLLLGLLSTIYGISSKTRAFLYTGIGFIIINILGQLIVFYPDDRLGRALILMATGAVITGLMVWFNIKREFLLSKIQLFRSDLEQWD